MSNFRKKIKKNVQLPENFKKFCKKKFSKKNPPQPGPFSIFLRKGPGPGGFFTEKISNPPSYIFRSPRSTPARSFGQEHAERTGPRWIFFSNFFFAKIFKIFRKLDKIFFSGNYFFIFCFSFSSCCLKSNSFCIFCAYEQKLGANVGFKGGTFTF